MTKDTQHLDFLISQYVDQTLDATTRRTIEQQIAADPVATALYKDHCEIQEVLEDWGNRLPMINWDEFNGTLAVRLEQEAPRVAQPISPFIRWSRALAAAAALFIAGAIGYTWHAFTTPVSHVSNDSPSARIEDAGPQHIVNFFKPATTGPSMDSVAYEHPPLVLSGIKVEVHQPLDHQNISPEPTISAGNSHNPGLQNMPNNTGSVVGVAVQPARKPDHTDNPSTIY